MHMIAVRGVAAVFRLAAQWCNLLGGGTHRQSTAASIGDNSERDAERILFFRPSGYSPQIGGAQILDLFQSRSSLSMPVPSSCLTQASVTAITLECNTTVYAVDD